MILSLYLCVCPLSSDVSVSLSERLSVYLTTCFNSSIGVNSRSIGISTLYDLDLPSFKMVLWRPLLNVNRTSGCVYCMFPRNPWPYRVGHGRFSALSNTIIWQRRYQPATVLRSSLLNTLLRVSRREEGTIREGLVSVGFNLKVNTIHRYYFCWRSRRWLLIYLVWVSYTSKHCTASSHRLLGKFRNIPLTSFHISHTRYVKSGWSRLHGGYTFTVFFFPRRTANRYTHFKVWFDGKRFISQACALKFVMGSYPWCGYFARIHKKCGEAQR